MTHLRMYFDIPGTSIRVVCTQRFHALVMKNGTTPVTEWDYIDHNNKDEVYTELTETFIADGLDDEWRISLATLGYIDPADCLFNLR